ncbi:MAG: tRNA pseudouridine(13) synthase TruD, partial [Thermoprotei archaeon]
MKTTYPHPLDYAVGIKHVITPLKINKEYRLSAESFYVKEIVDLNSLDFNTEKGNYVVFKVVKKNIDTLSTARVLEKYLGLPHGNVIILGLKDKNSTSTQYFFVKKELVREYIKINECIEIGSNVEACIIGFIGRKPRKEHLLGNKFRIILEASEKEYYMSKEILNKIIEIGVP